MTWLKSLTKSRYRYLYIENGNIIIILIQGTERLNDYGIMHGSILTVHVVEARDLKPMYMDGTSDPYVIL